MNHYISNHLQNELFAFSEDLTLQKSREKVQSFIIESVIFLGVIGEGNYSIKKRLTVSSLQWKIRAGAPLFHS